jgi:uncharacterized oligopeptide transporter (OPT) family protein
MLRLPRLLSARSFVLPPPAIAGDTSQDLKTGFLIGSTPKHQQIGEFFGVLSSALTMGIVMYFLKDANVAGELPLASEPYEAFRRRRYRRKFYLGRWLSAAL